MSERTPGPWTLSPSRRSEGAYYVEGPHPMDSLPWLVAEVSGQAGANESNARLIVAAPDLLDALEGLLSICDEELDPAKTPEMRNARRAIKKAKGEVLNTNILKEGI